MQRIAMFLVSFIMIFILTRSMTYAAGVPLPYRIGGTITSSGGLLIQADTKNLVVTVKGPDGSNYKDVNDNIAQDKDGLDSNNIYIIDIPIYD
ncbi:secreted protein, partial [Candidatus Magnetobacterium bavaricum]